MEGLSHLEKAAEVFLLGKAAYSGVATIGVSHVAH